MPIWSHHASRPGMSCAPGLDDVGSSAGLRNMSTTAGWQELLDRRPLTAGELAVEVTDEYLREHRDPLVGIEPVASRFPMAIDVDDDHGETPSAPRACAAWIA